MQGTGVRAQPVRWCNSHCQAFLGQWLMLNVFSKWTNTEAQVRDSLAAFLQQHTAAPDPTAVLPPHLKSTLPPCICNLWSNVLGTETKKLHLTENWNKWTARVLSAGADCLRIWDIGTPDVWWISMSTGSSPHITELSMQASTSSQALFKSPEGREYSSSQPSPNHLV